MQAGHARDHSPVGHFRPRIEWLSGTKACFNMTDRDASMVCRQSRCNGRCGISLHDNHVGSLRGDNGTEPAKYARGHAIEGLTAAHDCQVMMRPSSREFEHFVHHLAMSPGHADAAPEARVGLERRDQRE